MFSQGADICNEKAGMYHGYPVVVLLTYFNVKLLEIHWLVHYD